MRYQTLFLALSIATVEASCGSWGKLELIDHRPHPVDVYETRIDSTQCTCSGAKARVLSNASGAPRFINCTFKEKDSSNNTTTTRTCGNRQPLPPGESDLITCTIGGDAGKNQCGLSSSDLAIKPKTASLGPSALLAANGISGGTLDFKDCALACSELYPPDPLCYRFPGDPGDLMGPLIRIYSEAVAKHSRVLTTAEVQKAYNSDKNPCQRGDTELLPDRHFQNKSLDGKACVLSRLKLSSPEKDTGADTSLADIQLTVPDIVSGNIDVPSTFPALLLNQGKRKESSLSIADVIHFDSDIALDFVGDADYQAHYGGAIERAGKVNNRFVLQTSNGCVDLPISSQALHDWVDVQ